MMMRNYKEGLCCCPKFIWLQLLLLLFRMISLVVSSSSSSFYSYHSYLYDRTVPQFTPDGRLLQVEYAQKAGNDLSYPVAIIPLMTTTTTTDGCTDETTTDCLTFIGTIVRKKKKNTKTNTNNKKIQQELQTQTQHNNNQVEQSDTTTNHNDDYGYTNQNTIDDIYYINDDDVVQERIIILPPPFISSPVFQDDEVADVSTPSGGGGGAVIMIVSGIVADSIALLRYVQDVLQWYTRWYGCTNVFFNNPIQLIKCIAQPCHERTCGGGIRPYGSTFHIVSTSCNNNNNDHQKNNIIIHKTDPSGSIQTITLHSRTTNNHNVPIYLTGSGHPCHKELYHRISTEYGTPPRGAVPSLEQQIARTDDDDDENNQKYSMKNVSDKTNMNNKKLLQDQLGHILHILADEYQKNENDNSSNPNSDDNDKGNDNTLRMAIPTMEVVLYSNQRGTIKLSQYHIVKLIRRYRENERKKKNNNNNHLSLS